MAKVKHVIFGTGALGMAVMRELLANNKQVCLVNRSGVVPQATDVEIVKGDAADARQVSDICKDAETVYNCTGIPYPEWTEGLPAIMQGLIDGVSPTGAKLIHADNLYAYGKSPSGEYSESLPSNAHGPKGKIRESVSRLLIAAHRDGKVRAAIGRGSDFFGPGVRVSAVGEQVFRAAESNKPAAVLGDIDQPHTYIFISDFAKGLVALGEQPTALGDIWHMPSGPTITTREFIGMIYEEAGHEPKFRVAPKLMVSLFGLFSRNFKELKEVLYMYENPWKVDHGKFERAFGVAPTPHREAIKQTIASLK